MTAAIASIGAGTSTRHVANLTVARFFAALLVYCHHAHMVLQKPDIVPWAPLRTLFSNGYIGVTFFFVLSGFVIALSSYERMATPNLRGIATFYGKRVARIVPVWLFLSLPLIYLDVRNKGLTLPLLQYLTFTQAWSSDSTVAFGLLAVAWTLSCEMFFYAMFPLLAWLLAAAQRRWQYAAIALVVGAYAIAMGAAAWFAFDPERAARAVSSPDGPHRWLYQNPALRFCEFAVGVGLYVIFRDNLARLRRVPVVVSFAALAAGVATVALIMASTEAGPWTWTAAYILPCAVVIFALAALEVGASPLVVASPLLILLGEASYSFYLVHHQFGLGIPGANYGTLGALAWNLVMVASLSVGLYALIETPSRNALYRLLPGRRQGLPAATVPADA